MELMDLLQSRRAFREYDDQPLTSEELQPILLAANYNMACLASLPKTVIPAGMTPCFAITLGHTKEKLTPRDLDIKRIPINWIKED